MPLSQAPRRATYVSLGACVPAPNVMEPPSAATYTGRPVWVVRKNVRALLLWCEESGNKGPGSRVQAGVLCRLGRSWGVRTHAQCFRALHNRASTLHSRTPSRAPSECPEHQQVHGPDSQSSDLGNQIEIQGHGSQPTLQQLDHERAQPFSVPKVAHATRTQRARRVPTHDVCFARCNLG